MALADLDERSDRWELPRLPGRKIDRIVIGSIVRLHFDYEPGEEPNNDRPWSIGIEQPFEVVSANGEVATADFESTPRKLAPVLDLLWQPVESATVWLDGRLAVVFENGMRLDIPPHPDFEAWQVSGHDGLLIVCTPGGGEPALWPGGEDQIRYTFES